MKMNCRLLDLALPNRCLETTADYYSPEIFSYIPMGKSWTAE
ncbi:hypothetical protein [Nostoc sp. 'Peltigera membranacea cyanobiont' 210A]|nr:hypothetical protein [Nostoc sp. 'Peltigera membranacea cyanobiont' 210A]